MQGGGVYLAGQPLTQTDSHLVANVPDQCFGCAPSDRATERARTFDPAGKGRPDARDDPHHG